MEEYGVECDIWNVVQHEKPNNLIFLRAKVIF